MRSRNTDIRAIPVDFAGPDASDSFSASSKPFSDRLDALESSGLALANYVSVVCPEMSGNFLRGDTWGGVSGNVRKSRTIRYLGKIDIKKFSAVGMVPRAVRASFSIILTKFGDPNRLKNTPTLW